MATGVFHTRVFSCFFAPILWCSVSDFLGIFSFHFLHPPFSIYLPKIKWKFSIRWKYLMKNAHKNTSNYDKSIGIDRYMCFVCSPQLGLPCGINVWNYSCLRSLEQWLCSLCYFLSFLLFFSLFNPFLAFFLSISYFKPITAP